MKDFIRTIYNKLEKNKFKVLILFFVSIFFVICRNFFEIKNSSWYLDSFFMTKQFFSQSIFLFLHWIIWYIMVFFIVFSCYRYIIKMKIGDVLYFSLSTFILMIPVVVSSLLGQKMSLAYLDIHNIKDSLTGLLSLFILDKSNFVIFFEMIFLFIFCPFFSYKISKSWGRAIINTFAIFFLIAIFGAFLYVCPGPKCLFIIPSSFVTAFLPFYWVPLSFLSFIIFLLPEFIKYIKLKNNINPIVLLFGGILYLSLLVFLLNITRYFFDILFVSVTYFIFYIIFVFIVSNIKNKKYFDVILFLIVYDVIIFLLILSLIISKLI